MTRLIALAITWSLAMTAAGPAWPDAKSSLDESKRMASVTILVKGMMKSRSGAT